MSGRRRPRTQKRRAGQPRTLRTRLVVASVVLIAVVCSVIGTVTTLALRSHLYDQLFWMEAYFMFLTTKMGVS